MRGLTTTIVLLVVLGGLVGYIYFVDSKRETPDPNAKPKAYAELKADTIEELQIKDPAGDTSRVQKVGDDWQLLEPVKADADDGVVGTVTSNLSTLEVQRVVEEAPADLKQFGLDPPRLDVGFRLKGQKDFQRLHVGDKAPAGGDFFARRADEKKVILIPSFTDSIFTKTPFDLREKSILKFDRDKADGVEIVKTGGAPTLFARTGTEWRIVKPATARADYAASEGLLTRLSSTHMLKIVTENGGDLRTYGLDRPSVTATVTAGSSKATLLVGKMSDDGGYYAKDAARPVVFTVEQALSTDLGKEMAEFRRKDLFDARSFSATRLELRRGSETLAFEKSEAGGKTTWKKAGGQDADTAKIEDVLTKLSNLKADAFQAAAPPSMKMPAAAVTVRFDESKTETVTFGRSGTGVFASRSDESGAATVSAAAFDEAMKAADGLK
ncbi:MAG: DUF4340 domain-containing protein [Acidobacteria bacterium]|nr:DUF4340 domain-containing protein [Acidobacteriota bacterium]